MHDPVQQGRPAAGGVPPGARPVFPRFRGPRDDQAARHRRWRQMTWTADDIPDQSGRVAVVTGANGGLGLEVARALARKGALVVMAARDQAKASSARDSILGQV